MDIGMTAHYNVNTRYNIAIHCSSRLSSSDRLWQGLITLQIQHNHGIIIHNTNLSSCINNSRAFVSVDLGWDEDSVARTFVSKCSYRISCIYGRWWLASRI